MAYKYCTATNWGKGFFTHEERRQMYLRGHAGEVWVVSDNHHGDEWISKVDGAIKTKAEAQAMIGGEEISDTENYHGMNKKDLETFMRGHGIELDRRKTKSDLLKQVDDFFKD